MHCAEFYPEATEFDQNKSVPSIQEIVRNTYAKQCLEY